MNVTDAIQQRHSTRAFLDKVVTDDIINSLLDTARFSPSGANTQPWQVAVVTGDTKQRLQSTLQDAFASNIKPAPDYTYYPSNWQPPYLQRRKECGLQLYESLNITKDDKEGRLTQWAANYRAFDAPVLLLFFIDSVMETGSYLDYGMFLQSFMLLAQEQGLATCPQAAFADYPELIRSELGYDQNKHVICGIALGYENKSAQVNSYRTSREDVNSFTQFFN